ncbi:hypothetical protein F4825DRAFT_421603 [Nemania diffusa]|nr:hypothetical protein F4825DRAFT_421603 [Nemania diffusa]
MVRHALQLYNHRSRHPPLHTYLFLLLFFCCLIFKQSPRNMAKSNYSMMQTIYGHVFSTIYSVILSTATLGYIAKLAVIVFFNFTFHTAVMSNPRNEQGTSNLDSINATLAQPAWPFHNMRANIGRVGRHNIYVTAATHDDLDAMADFVAKYSFTIKQSTGIITSEVGSEAHSSGTIRLMRERYRDALKTIMDCCTPGIMTGVILKMEHDSKVKGVMALNILTEELDDPWSRNERQVTERGENLWIYPGAPYLKMLHKVITDNNNRNRPILNVPYLIVSMEGDFLQTGIIGFSKLLKGIVEELKHSAVVNIYCGNLYTMISQHLRLFLDFPRCGALADIVQLNPQSSQTYKVHGKFMRPTDPPPPDPYLDGPVRVAFSRL